MKLVERFMRYLYIFYLTEYLQFYVNSGYKYIMYDKFGLTVVSKRLPDKIIRGNYIFFNTRVDYVDESIITKWTDNWEESFIEIKSLIEFYKQNKSQD